jgi:hypothetical protein
MAFDTTGGIIGSIAGQEAKSMAGRVHFRDAQAEAEFSDLMQAMERMNEDDASGEETPSMRPGTARS